MSAWYDDGSSDGKDFGTNVPLTIDVIDPCQTATLTIDDTVFVSSPALKLLQFIEYASASITWTDAIITSTLSKATDPCGAYVYEIWDIGTGSEAALDATIFTHNDLTEATRILEVQTDDFDKDGVYDMRLVVHYANSPDKPFFKEFRVEI